MCCLTCDCVCVSSGMIRLPKATKSHVKNKVIPRQSLATIVKDLGENPHTAHVLMLCLCSVVTCWGVCCVPSAAISAPLKLKASRGPPTPINRNQASQPRGAQSLLGKRGFDSVSIPHTHTHTLLHLTIKHCCLQLLNRTLVFYWFTGDRGALPSQWEAVHFRYEDHLPVCHQEAEGQPGGGS